MTEKISDIDLNAVGKTPRFFRGGLTYVKKEVRSEGSRGRQASLTLDEMSVIKAEIIRYLRNPDKGSIQELAKLYGLHKTTLQRAAKAVKDGKYAFGGPPDTTKRPPFSNRDNHAELIDRMTETFQIVLGWDDTAMDDAVVDANAINREQETRAKEERQQESEEVGVKRTSTEEDAIRVFDSDWPLEQKLKELRNLAGSTTSEQVKMRAMELHETLQKQSGESSIGPKKPLTEEAMVDRVYSLLSAVPQEVAEAAIRHYMTKRGLSL